MSWTKRRSGLRMLNSVCMPQPAACRFPQKKKKKNKKRLVLNGTLAEFIGISREMFEPHCRRASSSDHPSGDLRASYRGLYVGEPPQRSPLHTAEIHPSRERKVRGGGGGGGVGQRHSPSCSTNGWHRGLFPS